MLEQDVTETIQKSPYLEILFLRDPQKKLGYIVIAETHSFYLKQAIRALLHLTSPNLLLTNPEDDQSVLIDQDRVDNMLVHLITNIFPNISHVNERDAVIIRRKHN